MPEEGVDLDGLIRDIKIAIQAAQLLSPDVVVTKAQLELKTVFAVGPNLEAKLGPVDIAGKYNREQLQTLSLSLTPEPPVVELLSRRSDELTQAIVAISSAAHDAASSEPRFLLDEAFVRLHFAVEKGGRAKFVIGADVSSTNTHELTLTLKCKG